jgi:hypothetical protein
MKKYLILPFALCVITSCAVHRGTISTSATDKNIVYKDIAIGVSECKQILGFGGLSQDALIYEAKKELFKNYPLNANELYLNYVLDIKNSYFIVFSKTKITITADIAEYTKDSLLNPYTSKYRILLGMQPSESKLFEVGDSIIFDKYIKVTIISFAADQKARILCENNRGKLFTKKVSISQLYTNKKNYKDYKIGEFKPYFDRDNKPLSGKIFAVGENSYMLIESNGELRIEDYK